MGRLGRAVGALIAIALLAGLGWLAWYLTHPAPATGPAQAPGQPGRPAAGPGRGTPPTTVGVATAEQADIPILVEALGTVTPAATAVVRAQVAGVLQRVLYREGQEVKTGQVLAVIDPRQFELAVTQATGQRMRDEAQLENAKLTLQRYQTLLQQDSIARQDVDTQAALVKQLEAAVIADRGAEGTARLNLERTRIVAPIDGRIGLRVVDVGNYVSASDANGIAVITRLTPIDVEFSVPQDLVREVQKRATTGTRIPVVALDRARTAVLDRGAFLTLDNQVDPQTGTVRAKARFANKEAALFPSQFVNVRMVLRTLEAAVVVPAAAIRYGSQGDYVYVLNEAERTVALRPVTRGPAMGDRVAVEKGLALGEKVITEGADRLRDGSRVLLPGAGAGAAGGAGRPGKGMRPDGKGPAGGAAGGPVGGAVGGAAGGAGPTTAPGAGRPAGAEPAGGQAPGTAAAGGAPRSAPSEGGRPDSAGRPPNGPGAGKAEGDPERRQRRRPEPASQ